MDGSDNINEKRFAGSVSSDELLLGQACPYDTEMRQILIGSMRPFFDRADYSPTCLELGCGAGSTTVLVLKEFPKIDLVAVDNESRMLQRFRSRLQEQKESKSVRIIEREMLDYLLQLQNNSFDLIVSTFTLHNLKATHRRNVLVETFRVLRPGGLFINGDKYAQASPLHEDALAQRLKSFFRVFTAANRFDLLQDWTIHYAIDELSDRVMSESNALNEMREIGFVNVSSIYRKEMEAFITARKA